MSGCHDIVRGVFFAPSRFTLCSHSEPLNEEHPRDEQYHAHEPTGRERVRRVAHPAEVVYHHRGSELPRHRRPDEGRRTEFGRGEDGGENDERPQHTADPDPRRRTREPLTGRATPPASRERRRSTSPPPPRRRRVPPTRVARRRAATSAFTPRLYRERHPRPQRQQHIRPCHPSHLSPLRSPRHRAVTAPRTALTPRHKDQFARASPIREGALGVCGGRQRVDATDLDGICPGEDAREGCVRSHQQVGTGSDIIFDAR